MNTVENEYKYKGYLHKVFESQTNFDCIDMYDLSNDFISVLDSKKYSKIINRVDHDFEDDIITFYFIEKYDIAIAYELKKLINKSIYNCVLATRDNLNKYIDFESIDDMNNFIDWLATTENIMNQYVVGNILSFRL